MKGVRSVAVIIQLFVISTVSNGADARAAGMANAYAAFSGDIWSFFHNAGGLSGLSNLQTGISYTPGFFNMSELSATTFVFGLPTPVGSFGCAVNKYGCELYNELTLGVSYASAVSDFHFGVICWRHNVSIPGYGSARAVIIDAGFLVSLLPELDIGLVLRNLGASTIGRIKEQLPQTIVSGISYRPMKSLTLTADLEKETMFPPHLRCGLEYFAMDAFAVRAGIAGESASYSCGIGIVVSSFRFDYGINVHRLLGITHIFSVTLL